MGSRPVASVLLLLKGLSTLLRGVRGTQAASARIIFPSPPESAEKRRLRLGPDGCQADRNWRPRAGPATGSGPGSARLSLLRRAACWA
jgi:hypothetical protein